MHLGWGLELPDGFIRNSDLWVLFHFGFKDVNMSARSVPREWLSELTAHYTGNNQGGFIYIRD